MKRVFAVCACAVVVTSVAVAQTSAQTTPPPQTQTAPQTPSASQPATDTAQPTTTMGQQTTIAGCVQRETDYRRERNLGRGGVVGTGVGATDEFVLVTAPSGSQQTGVSGGTIGTAYELTGRNENLVAAHVGKHVEIVGVLKPAAVGTSGPTGGATAGKPPTGVDVISPDLRLREVEVTSVRVTEGTCAAAPR